MIYNLKRSTLNFTWLVLSGELYSIISTYIVGVFMGRAKRRPCTYTCVEHPRPWGPPPMHVFDNFKRILIEFEENTRDIVKSQFKEENPMHMWNNCKKLKDMHVRRSSHILEYLGWTFSSKYENFILKISLKIPRQQEIYKNGRHYMEKNLERNNESIHTRVGHPPLLMQVGPTALVSWWVPQVKHIEIQEGSKLK